MGAEDCFNLGPKFLAPVCMGFIRESEDGDAIGDLDPMSAGESGLRFLRKRGEKNVAPTAGQINKRGHGAPRWCDNCCRGRRWWGGGWFVVGRRLW